MSVSPFFDTNVLIYAFRESDPRSQTARKLLGEGGATGVQVLNEFVATARRKLGFSWEEVLASLEAIRVLCPADSLIFAAAIEAGSRRRNPFSGPR